MSYTARRSLIGLILTLIIVPVFYIFYFGNHVSLDYNAPIDFVAWAWGFIWFFLILIVIRIVLTIMQVIIESIVYGIKNQTKDKKEIEGNLKNIFIEDERYKLIDLRATKHIGTIMTFTFMLSMILIVSGVGAAVLLHNMFFAIGVSGFVLDLLTLIYEVKEN